jgi:hypothetical protein
MTWILSDGSIMNELPSGKPEGFVYRITNLANGKMYIGKKSFWSSKTIVVNGKKKKTKVESSWKSYYGSNEALQTDVKEFGTENFKREVLSIHKSKSLVSYYEAKWQFQEDALLKPDQYYNSWIMVRVRTAHIAGKE